MLLCFADTFFSRVQRKSDEGMVLQICGIVRTSKQIIIPTRPTGVSNGGRIEVPFSTLLFGELVLKDLTVFIENEKREKEGEREIERTGFPSKSDHP